MAKNIKDYINSSVQKRAYKDAKLELKAHLSELGKDAIHNEVEKNKTLSLFKILRTLPLVMLKQTMYRKGWNESIYDAVVGNEAGAKELNNEKRPFLRMAVRAIGVSLVAGMAVGAMASFALVGGTIPIAALAGGGILSAAFGIVTTATILRHKTELNEIMREGEKAGIKSKNVKKLKLKKEVASKVEEIEEVEGLDKPVVLEGRYKKASKTKEKETPVAQEIEETSEIEETYPVAQESVETSETYEELEVTKPEKAHASQTMRHNHIQAQEQPNVVPLYEQREYSKLEKKLDELMKKCDRKSSFAEKEDERKNQADMQQEATLR